MSDDGLVQRFFQMLQGTGVPTPFGWAPPQNAQNLATNLTPSRDTVADTLGFPVDAAAYYWRKGDMNPPEIQDRFYSQPPMLGSDSIRGMLGGDPGPTPGRAWVKPGPSFTNTPGGTPPAAMQSSPSVLDIPASPSWPSVLAAILHGGMRR